jgi:hypothetical protein
MTRRPITIPQRPSLLDSSQGHRQYEIHLKLQEGKTAIFTYSDRFLARSHWEQLQGQGMVGGHAINGYEFREVTE